MPLSSKSTRVRISLQAMMPDLGFAPGGPDADAVAGLTGQVRTLRRGMSFNTLSDYDNRVALTTNRLTCLFVEDGVAQMNRRILEIAGMAAAAAGTAAAAEASRPNSHPVVELRQYKLVHGAQEKFIALFDREFVDTQEALGMRLIGQFHDHDRRDRFTWIREFPDMSARAQMLDSFYNGPVWAKHRGVANPLLDDNDNVLLLRPARDGSGFGPSTPRAAIGAAPKPAETYFAVIEYLWKDPNDGFSSFFLDHAAPLLEQAGLPILGVYVPEELPNNFPRLPTRPDRKVLIWFTKASQPDDFDAIRRNLALTPAWRQSVGSALSDAEERPPQILRLDPTPRSALQ
ncbi:NIPSNAP family protein [Sphingomonas sp.]|uniref:NIPSNAP family protein n=1 Tax=Sphingomonas sp. TaxID=28214 RepID=UPI0025FB246B|nr:NIPSNAP family protein [Sphingomonas sp.]MBV9527939.1 NIPSNAP family protein [Sphingomonas sp.]